MSNFASATKVLIVKTSSLGDIIQSLAILDYLHRIEPGIIVDWVVDSDFFSIVAAHPLVRRAIPLSIRGLKKKRSLKNLWKEMKILREETYDLLFDLQKNTKSGLITLAANSIIKVGFGYQSVREWPNILATTVRFDISKTLHSNLQSVALLQRYFKDETPFQSQPFLFTLSEKEKMFIHGLIQKGSSARMMICPGSTGLNRQIPILTLANALKSVGENLSAFFYLIWGDEDGRKQCQQLQEFLGEKSLLVERLSIPMWQNLIEKMDLVVAVDSSALHLCATTSTPSFSLFGPTKADNVKPLGPRHQAIQGTCPYGKTFIRQCPIMRTCATGACMKDLQAEAIAQKLIQFYSSLATADFQ